MCPPVCRTDLELLQAYARERAEPAFAELVRRHLGLVHSAALRQVRSPALAEEVSQSVFADLARQASRLAPETILPAWLYQVTRRTAIDVVRREARRRQREQTAFEMNAMNDPSPDWARIEPLLDEAVSSLGPADRSAVLLRYFEGKSFREVGAALGTSEDAAQKRVGRAVELLRGFFARRGVPVGAGGLGVVLAGHAVQAAPAGLDAAISTMALSSSASALTVPSAGNLFVMTTLQKTMAAAALALLAGLAVHRFYQGGETAGPAMASVPPAASVPQVAALKEKVAGSPAKAKASSAWLSTLSEVELALREMQKLPRPERREREASFPALVDPALYGADFFNRLLPLLTGPDGLPFNTDDLLPRLLGEWARTDPRSALAYAAAMTLNLDHTVSGNKEYDFMGGPTVAGNLAEVRMAATQVIFRVWREGDPSAALAWLNSLPEASTRRTLTGQLVDGLARKSPEEAARFTASLPAGKIRDSANETLAYLWGYHDPAAAIAWLGTFPEGPERNALVPRFVSGYVQKSPDEASRLINSLSPGTIRDQLVHEVAGNWAEKAPREAATWVEQFAEGPDRDDAFCQIIQKWALHDPAAAGEWLNRQPSGTSRDSGVAAFVMQTAHSHPETAALWAEQLPPGKARKESLESVAYWWLRKDAAAAQAWLPQSTLSPAQQAIQLRNWKNAPKTSN